MKKAIIRCGLLAILCVFPSWSITQTVQKSSLSSFQFVNPNDSLIAVGGQVVSGESLTPRVLHGYLPLQYSLLSTTEFSGASLKCFPNPADDFIHIQFDGSTLANGEIKIYDIRGEIVFACFIANMVEFIDIGQLQAGVYLLEVRWEKGGCETLKVIKK